MIKYQYIVDNQKNLSSNTSAHYHSCYELVYYFQGNGYSDYMPTKNQQQKTLVYGTRITPKKSQRFNVTDNSFIIYKPYTLHNEVLSGPSNVFAIVFSTPDGWEFPSCILSDKDGKVAKAIEKIKKEYANKKYEFNVAINCLLTHLFIQIKRETISDQKENPSIQQAITFLNDYFTTNIDLSRLASSIGYSLDHFRFLFKNETGISPKKYILLKRLELAKKQILYTDYPLREIAENCGYIDYYQFSTYFKKQTGKSPAEFKKINKNI